MNNELWIKQANYEFISEASEIEKFIIYAPYDTMFFEKHPQEKFTPHQYYLRIYNNDSILVYEKISKKIKYADYVDKGMYSSGDINDKIIDNSEMYISIGKTTVMKKIDKKSNSLLKYLPKNEIEKGKQYLKNKKFSKKLNNKEIKMLFVHLFGQE
jgi:hypothetical protein